MKEQKKELRSGTYAPRLDAAKQAEFSRASTKSAGKLLRWYKIYLATTIGTVVLTVLLLLVGLRDADLLHIPSGEEIASFLLSGEFIDLSGDDLPDITGAGKGL